MGKSIRAKSRKRVRSELRNTVGLAQATKFQRKALRRLAASVGEQAGASAGAEALVSALAGTDGSGGKTAASASAAAIRVLAGPARDASRLRHSFNTGLRAARLAADLEDLTDDDEDVRLGRLDRIAAATRRAAGKMSDDEDEEDDSDADADAGDTVEEAGVRFGPGKTQPKRGVYQLERPAEGFVGAYASDPIFSTSNRAKKRAERKAKAAQNARSRGR